MIVEREIKTIQELVTTDKLTIPGYQRPYKWQAKNVQKLLEDIETHRQEEVSRYRIGTVVIHQDKNDIHQDKNDLNIVDGQQRITTLVLILKALEYKQGEVDYFPNFEYSHKTSQYNICQNHEAIKEYISSLDDKDKFCKFLLENCEVVYIVLDDIDEAFQFFDSQNARGKSLEAYDLLKAFHLREMREDNEADKIQAVEQWEEASRIEIEKDKADDLKIVFNDLFAIRRYSREQKVRRNYGFTKADVDEFKGVNPDKYNYPYMRSYLMNDYFIKGHKDTLILLCESKNIAYPFQITGHILNGKRFFEYIQYYIDLKAKLKAEKELKYTNFLIPTGGTGDQYVSHLFQRILLFYYDKFGDKDLAKAEEYLFVWAYTLRQQYAVKFSSVNNYAIKPNFLFRKISHTLYHNEFIKKPTQQDFNRWINGIKYRNDRTGNERIKNILGNKK